LFNFAVWESIIDNSPFSKEIIYKVGTHNTKTIKAIISKDNEDYSISQFIIEIKVIELADNVTFIIDEKEYKIISFEKTQLNTIKVWIEEIK